MVFPPSFSLSIKVSSPSPRLNGQDIDEIDSVLLADMLPRVETLRPSGDGDGGGSWCSCKMCNTVYSFSPAASSR